MKSVFLIGTRHSIQKDHRREDFKNYIIEAIKKNCITAIAEEIDKDSIASKIADEFSKKYKIIEPNKAERENLGIPSLAAMTHSVSMELDDADPSESIARLEEVKESSYRLREREWLRRINAMNESHILVIFGSAHYQQFRKLLSESSFTITDLCADWCNVPT